MICRAPFRQALVRTSCVRCHEAAVLRCERCAVPLCSTHAPPTGHRCFDCETTFESRINRPSVFILPLLTWLAAMGGVAVAFAITAPESRGHFIAWFSLLTITLVMIPFVVGSARFAYGFIARRHFLAQRTQLSWRPVDGSEETWFELGASLDPLSNDPRAVHPPPPA